MEDHEIRSSSKLEVIIKKHQDIFHWFPSLNVYLFPGKVGKDSRAFIVPPLLLAVPQNNVV